ncbi:MAG: pilus assembly protein [Beijerinckiaceae bacterium]
MKRFRLLWRRFAHHWLCDRSGLAAVEFALILPLMLTLYLGIVELTKGYMASQRITLVARAISDLTAQTQQLQQQQQQQQAGTCGSAIPPCVTDAIISNIFAASGAVMAPFPTTSLTMTVSQIVLGNKSDGTCCQAKVDWTIAYNGGTKRPCQILTPANATPVSVATIPVGFTVPASTIGPLIVADVTYAYAPGFGFELYKWNVGKVFNMAQTQYMRPRGTNALTYAATTGTKCP